MVVRRKELGVREGHVCRKGTQQCHAQCSITGTRPLRVRKAVSKPIGKERLIYPFRGGERGARADPGSVSLLETRYLGVMRLCDNWTRDGPMTRAVLVPSGGVRAYG